jgi:hypothetical protein
MDSKTIASGDDDDWNYCENRNLPEPFHYREPVARWQTEIQDNQIWSVLPRLGNTGERIGGKEGLVVVGLEAQVHAQANICIIIHNENFPAIHF